MVTILTTLRALAKRLRFTFGLQPARKISARMSRYVRSAESPALNVATLNVAGDMAAEGWTLAGLHCPLQLEAFAWGV